MMETIKGGSVVENSWLLPGANSLGVSSVDILVTRCVNFSDTIRRTLK